jgi:hypothetical protein
MKNGGRWGVAFDAGDVFSDVIEQRLVSVPKPKGKKQKGKGGKSVRRA